MNCKLEKFWNDLLDFLLFVELFMNCKLEKFWNKENNMSYTKIAKWTVNLKSFEILLEVF